MNTPVAENGTTELASPDGGEFVDYIFSGYHHLLTGVEKLALRRIFFEAKSKNMHGAIEAMLRRKIPTDVESELLLANGPDAFRLRVRARILAAEHCGEIHLNRCPKCEALARTPRACLCPSCNHTWYETRGTLPPETSGQ